MNNAYGQKKKMRMKKTSLVRATSNNIHYFEKNKRTSVKKNVRGAGMLFTMLLQVDKNINIVLLMCREYCTFSKWHLKVFFLGAR